MRVTKQQRIDELEKKLAECEAKKREAEEKHGAMEKILSVRIAHPEVFYDKNGDFKREVLFAPTPESRHFIYRVVSSTDGRRQYSRDFYAEKLGELLIIRESEVKNTQSNQVTSPESTLFIGRIPKSNGRKREKWERKPTEASLIRDLLFGYAYEYAKSIAGPNKLEIRPMNPANPAEFEAEWKEQLKELSISPRKYSCSRFLLGILTGAAAAGGAAYAIQHYFG